MREAALANVASRVETKRRSSRDVLAASLLSSRDRAFSLETFPAVGLSSCCGARVKSHRRKVETRRLALDEAEGGTARYARSRFKRPRVRMSFSIYSATYSERSSDLGDRPPARKASKRTSRVERLDFPPRSSLGSITRFLSILLRSTNRIDGRRIAARKRNLSLSSLVSSSFIFERSIPRSENEARTKRERRKESLVESRREYGEYGQRFKRHAPRIESEASRISRGGAVTRWHSVGDHRSSSYRPIPASPFSLSRDERRTFYRV